MFFDKENQFEILIRVMLRNVDELRVEKTRC
jgi:hypothetical protein